MTGLTDAELAQAAKDLLARAKVRQSLADDWTTPPEIIAKVLVLARLGVSARRAAGARHRVAALQPRWPTAPAAARLGEPPRGWTLLANSGCCGGLG